MALRRVFYKADGSVSIVAPFSSSKFNYEEACTRTVEASKVYDKDGNLIDPGLSGLDYDDIDTSELPPRIDRGKWRGSKGAGVHTDHTVITAADRRKVLETDLDAELAKPAGNPMVALKLQRKLDKKEY